MKTLNALLTTIVAIGAITSLRAADESPTYPLKTCVVSGEDLDSMGKPFVFMYEGQEVQLCCKKCKKKFDSDPAAYIKKIEDARTGESSTPDADASQH